MKEKIMEYLDKYIDNLNKLKEINEKSPYKIIIADFIQIHEMDSFDEICKELGLEYEDISDDEYIHKRTFHKGIEIVSVQRIKNAPNESANSI